MNMEIFDEDFSELLDLGFSNLVQTLFMTSFVYKIISHILLISPFICPILLSFQEIKVVWSSLFALFFKQTVTNNNISLHFTKQHTHTHTHTKKEEENALRCKTVASFRLQVNDHLLTRSRYLFLSTTSLFK